MDMKPKKLILAGTHFVLALLVAATPGYAFEQDDTIMGPTNANRSDNTPMLHQSWQCPDQAGRDMKAGPHHGYGTGPGMMEPGAGYGLEYKLPRHRPLKKEQAKQAVELYLETTGHTNIKLGGIKDQGPYYEVKIFKRNSSSLVDLIIVDKNTGCLCSML